MKEGTPKQLRGRSLGTRLSEAEDAQCEKSASRRGQSLSEWCRRVLLEASQETTLIPLKHRRGWRPWRKSSHSGRS